MVPESALFAIGLKHYLYTVDNKDSGVVKREEVTVGTHKEGKVEITAGLKSGLFVITHGGIKLFDGSPVKIMAIDDGHLDVAEVLRKQAAQDAAP